MSRRSFLGRSARASLAFGLTSRWTTLGGALAASPAKKRLVLLWMEGGPSQLDTFDPKPGTAHAGPCQAIATSVSGIQVAEHLPAVAREMHSLAVIRTLGSREGNHPRARYLLHTGYPPGGAVHHPGIGSVVAHELHEEEQALPSFVSIGGLPIGSGFLGPECAPFQVQDAGRAPASLHAPKNVDDERYARRIGLLEVIEGSFQERAPDLTRAHGVMRARAIAMMRAGASHAFDVSEEPERVRSAYGDTAFGRGVLVARRLIEAGVPAVEVALKGWDTHENNFERVRALASELDPAMASLIRDLRDRGLLEHTLVVWMGEFGRTPAINGKGGRDHFPRAYSAVLAGAGLRGGVVVGSTSADGMEVRDRPVTVPELFATIHHALGIPRDRVFATPEGRPVPIAAPGAEPIRELV